MSKLYFNRIHLEVPSNTNKRAFILDSLQGRAATPYNDFSYKISDLQILDDYVVGYMIKYDPYGRGEYLDENTGQRRRGGTVNNIVAKSLFILRLSEMVIAFEEITNHISKRNFKERLLEIVRENNPERNYDFSIRAITEEYSFVERVRTLRKINKITISLVPSNPRFSDRWRNVDERLRELHITSYKEIQESRSSEGIEIDEETESKMAMSEDGYGKSVASGFDETGRLITIATDQRNQEVSQDLPHSVEERGFRSVIEHVTEKFNDIAARTEHTEGEN
ncbi:DUF4747 family protein [Flavobacterium silvisoli]|uniref:DUF4747 family protein n=1 Tax=Flavobacterium silvisoli TaxID=2529433 RepID=A0A4Q9YVB9_9FLAO|nr:DUF4747 family protein [Flavobacterium silvisoli]TBX67484.1 DUF4747 family protein [Flavobacterium silvisoli]